LFIKFNDSFLHSRWSSNLFTKKAIRLFTNIPVNLPLNLFLHWLFQEEQQRFICWNRCC